MRRIEAEVEVEARAGRPLAVVYRGRRRVLAWHQRWRSKGRWLLGEGVRVYWQVEVEGGLTLELYYQEGAEQWVLVRLWD